MKAIFRTAMLMGIAAMVLSMMQISFADDLEKPESAWCSEICGVDRCEIYNPIPCFDHCGPSGEVRVSNCNAIICENCL